MPDIDVSNLLDDSFIAAEAFDIIRRRVVMQANGTEQVIQTIIQASGSITPVGDNTMIRTDAFTSQANAVKVITQFRIHGEARDANGNRFQPDLIRDSDGNTFIVRVVNEWSRFGAGFIEADCEQIDYSPLAGA